MSTEATDLATIEAEAKQRWPRAPSVAELTRWNSTYLGDKGLVTAQARRSAPCRGRSVPRSARPSIASRTS